MNKRSVGSKYEEMAALYLNKMGVIVTDRNYRNHYGEIDIIGRQGGYFIFFEVKYRKDTGSGNPVEAVDLKKQYRISRVADHYRIYRKLKDTDNVRFDVVAILGDKIEWYKNAFSYIPY